MFCYMLWLNPKAGPYCRRIRWKTVTRSPKQKLPHLPGKCHREISGLGMSYKSCKLLGAWTNTKLVGECSAIIDMISLFDSELSAYIFSFSIRGPQFGTTELELLW